MAGKVFTALAAVAVSLVLVASAQATGNAANVTLGTTSAEVRFNDGVNKNPDGSYSYDPNFNDTTIFDGLAPLISNAQPGSSIGITVHLIADNGRIENALKTAANNGVHVYIITYQPNVPNAFNDWSAIPHAIKECSDGCMAHLAGGYMHSKFATFSSTRRNTSEAYRQATWIGSNNYDADTGNQSWNNAITWFGQTAVYDGMVKVFQDMWAHADGTAFPDYYQPELGDGHGYFTAADANTTAYMSPDQDSDIWYSRLKYIHPAAEGGTSTCAVRVATSYFADKLMDDAVDRGTPNNNPAQRLADLKSEGCAVWVLAHRAPDSPEPNPGVDSNGDGDKQLILGQRMVEPRTRAKLCNAGIPVRTIQNMHDKYVISNSTYGSVDNDPQVMMGSHNITWNALRQDDEVLARISSSQALYDQYYNHFGEAWTFAKNACY